MEVKSILRRTQSLRSVHTERTLSVPEIGLRERKKSVSQLVAQYQFSVKGKTTALEQEKQEHILAALPIPVPLPVCEGGADSEGEPPVPVVPVVPAVRGGGARERPSQPLSRSRSMESLPRGGRVPGGTSALRALFESKVMTPRELKRMGQPTNTPLVNGGTQVKLEAEDTQDAEEQVEEVTGKNTHDPPLLRSEEEAAPKAARRTRPERRKTVSGVYLDRTYQTAEDREKRRSIADFRDGDLLYGREKPAISVKAMSALYQSKVAAAETSGNLLKQEMDSSNPSGKRPRAIKFQPAEQDMCSVCLKPVYPMERMVTDKFIFHRNCFCCKHCRKKLSIGNYAPLYGEFYCVFHYQQLFRKKGNYDEGFGHPQHKARWLQHRVNGTEEI